MRSLSVPRWKGDYHYPLSGWHVGRIIVTRTVFPFQAEDISRLSRSLCTQLAEHGMSPGHQTMLNMLARACAFSNYQSWLAARQVPPEVNVVTAPKEASTLPLAKLVRYYDAQGRLCHWPKKRSWQLPCLWLIAEGIPAGPCYREQQINQLIDARHGFGDYAMLRRDLISLGVLTRTVDGAEYRRNPIASPPEAKALREALSAVGIAMPDIVFA